MSGLVPALARCQWHTAVESISVKVEVVAVGKKFTWNGQDWIEDANPIEEEIQVYAKPKSWQSIGGLNLLDSGNDFQDAKRILNGIKDLFSTAATELSNQPVDAQQRIESEVDADEFYFPGD